MGLAEGCRLKRDIAKNSVLTYEDVELPKGRLCDRLHYSHFVDKYLLPFGLMPCEFVAHFYVRTGRRLPA